MLSGLRGLWRWIQFNRGGSGEVGDSDRGGEFSTENVFDGGGGGGPQSSSGSVRELLEGVNTAFSAVMRGRS